jgi:hypothetical protein
MSEEAEAPKVGMSYFDRNGRKVELVAAVESGFVVAPIVLIPAGGWGDDFDEMREEESGHLEIVPSLFPTAPTEIYDEQIADLKAKVEDERQVLRTLQDDIRGATAERRALLDKLKQVPALQHIEAAIERRFTHIVTRSYGPPYQIGPIDEVLASNDRYSKGLKLLTLYGDTKGDLQWRISHYSDGSGGASDAWPFASEDDALAFLRKQIAEDIDYHSGQHSDSRPYYIVALCKQAREIGVAIPTHVVAIEKAEARKVAEHHLSEARKSAQQAQARLIEAEAQAQAVLS